MRRPVKAGLKKQSRMRTQKQVSSTFETGLLLRFAVHRYKNHTTFSVSYKRPNFSWLKITQQKQQIRYSNVFGVALLVGGIVGLGSVVGPSFTTASETVNANNRKDTLVASYAENFVSKSDAARNKPYSMPHSIPVKLEAPSIGLQANLITTTITPTGELAVPESTVEGAWYDLSPTPGELGPSVIVGHVSSYYGDAVFAALHQIVPSADIWVQRADGSRAQFRVEKVIAYPQDAFPTEEVYGAIEYAGLRLITCAGRYNYHTGRYTDNTIVFARLTKE